MEERIKLLYAEDEDIWAQAVRRILEMKGFEIEIAWDGDEALKKFRTYDPDIVLLDIDMPGLGGWELIRELKKEKEWIPLVLYSSFYDSKKLNEAFGLGAEDFLSKTCQPEELSDRLLAFYNRAVCRKEKTEIIRISDRVIFNPVSGTLTFGEESKEVLKRNESKLLYLLCMKMNQEADKEYLCEGIWGRGMYNETKCKALKICVTNLRKYLCQDSSVELINKRWGGYCLINKEV